MREKVDAIVSWLQGKIKQSGVEGLVVGISGGVDSALISALAMKACAKDKVLGLIIPCGGSKADEESAMKVVKAIDIDARRVDLSGILAEFDVQVNRDLPEETQRLRYANAKSRLRMVALYYYANALNYLVLGTSNRTEIELGYYTKYGDGGVDIEPIGHLLKREVREMAAYLGIPDEVVNRTPSAGLWEGQTDEEEIGFSYDELDKAVNGEKVDDQVSKMVENMKVATEHKRQMPTTFPE